MNTRGIALYLVLTVLLVVVILTSVILSLISSQSKLADHQLRRIQAYYAGQAAINYALEELRLGTAGWGPGLPKTMCRAVGSVPCTAPDIIEADLPSSVRYVTITIDPPVSGQNAVHAAVNYTAF
jgi:Tfp pilus assembly protein PilX